MALEALVIAKILTLSGADEITSGPIYDGWNWRFASTEKLGRSRFIFKFGLDYLCITDFRIFHDDLALIVSISESRVLLRRSFG